MAELKDLHEKYRTGGVSEEEARTATGDIRSFLKGATLGISEAVVSKISDILGAQEQIMLAQRDYEAQNPGRSTAAGVAGAVVSPVSKLGMGASVGAGVVRTAVEMGAGAVAQTAVRRAADYVADADITPDGETTTSFWHAISSDPLEYLFSALLGSAGGVVERGTAKIGQTVKNVVAKKADAELGKIVRRTSAQKALEKAGLSEAEAVTKTTQEGIFGDAAKVAEKRKIAGNKMGELVNKIDPTTFDGDGIVLRTLDRVQAVVQNSNKMRKEVVEDLMGRLTHLAENNLSPDKYSKEASILLKKARLSGTFAGRTGEQALDPHEADLFNDTANFLYREIENTLSNTGKDLGSEYASARTAYKQYINLEKVFAGAAPQAESDLGKAAANYATKVATKTAVGAVSGAILGGKFGGIAGAGAGAALGLTGGPAQNRYLQSRAVLKLMTDGWMAKGASAVQGALESALKPANMSLAASKLGPHEYYKQTSELVRQIEADPEGYAERMHENLVKAGLGVQMADAMVVKTMNSIGAVREALPQKEMYGTLFDGDDPDWEPDTRKAIQFQRTFMAHFQPLDVIRTGDPLGIKMVYQAHPELRDQMVKYYTEKFSDADKRKLSYEQKRRLGTILDAIGVSTQNPLQGAQIQNIHSNTKQRALQGQENSARVVKAVGNRDASMAASRSNQISNPGKFR